MSVATTFGSENPVPTLLSVLDALTRTLSRANRYPDLIPERLPRVPIILDESHVEFISPPDSIDAVVFVQRHPNVSALMIFPKADGLAGLRSGYVFRHGELIGMVGRLRRRLAKRVSQILAEQDCSRDRLRRNHFDVPDTKANFRYVPGGGAAERLARCSVVAKGNAGEGADTSATGWGNDIAARRGSGRGLPRRSGSSSLKGFKGFASRLSASAISQCHAKTVAVRSA